MTVLLPPLPEEKRTIARSLLLAWRRIPLWTKGIAAGVVLIAIAALVATTRYHGDVVLKVTFGDEKRISADAKNVNFGEVKSASEVQRTFRVTNRSGERLEVGYCILFRTTFTAPVCTWSRSGRESVGPDDAMEIGPVVVGGGPADRLWFQVLFDGFARSTTLDPGDSAEVTVIARNAGERTAADYSGKLLMIVRGGR